MPWTAKMSNELVIVYTRPEASLLGLIRKQQLSYFGHIVRAEGLEKEMVMGKVGGGRRRGRQRIRWLDSLSKVMGLSIIEMTRATHDRS